MRIIHKEGDLLQHKILKEFDFIVHACNCKGNWGAGFARSLKNYFPEAYDTHRRNYECGRNRLTPEHSLGQYEILFQKDQPSIINLFVSYQFGSRKCHRNDIVKHTRESLESFASMLRNTHNFRSVKIVSPKFNAGLFMVPWKETEEIIKEVFDGMDVTWVVYSLY